MTKEIITGEEILEDVSDFERDMLKGKGIEKISGRADLIIDKLKNSGAASIGIIDELRMKLDAGAANSILADEKFGEINAKILEAKRLAEEVIPTLSDLAKKYNYEGLD